MMRGITDKRLAEQELMQRNGLGLVVCGQAMRLFRLAPLFTIQQ